jgi:hypothetical protein
MNVDVQFENPAFFLRARNGYSAEYEEKAVSWEELRRASVGTRWEVRDRSNCVRASRSEAATVVFRDHRGVAVLFREWGTTDDQNPRPFERVDLVWYEFHAGTAPEEDID